MSGGAGSDSDSNRAMDCPSPTHANGPHRDHGDHHRTMVTEASDQPDSQPPALQSPAANCMRFSRRDAELAFLDRVLDLADTTAAAAAVLDGDARPKPRRAHGQGDAVETPTPTPAASSLEHWSGGGGGGECIPLLERLRFLAIVASSLDAFSLKRLGKLELEQSQANAAVKASRAAMPERTTAATPATPSSQRPSDSRDSTQTSMDATSDWAVGALPSELLPVALLHQARREQQAASQPDSGSSSTEAGNGQPDTNNSQLHRLQSSLERYAAAAAPDTSDSVAPTTSSVLQSNDKCMVLLPEYLQVNQHISQLECRMRQLFARQLQPDLAAVGIDIVTNPNTLSVVERSEVIAQCETKLLPHLRISTKLPHPASLDAAVGTIHLFVGSAAAVSLAGQAESSSTTPFFPSWFRPSGAQDQADEQQQQFLWIEIPPVAGKWLYLARKNDRHAFVPVEVAVALSLRQVAVEHPQLLSLFAKLAILPQSTGTSLSPPYICAGVHILRDSHPHADTPRQDDDSASEIPIPESMLQLLQERQDARIVRFVAQPLCTCSLQSPCPACAPADTMRAVYQTWLWSLMAQLDLPLESVLLVLASGHRAASAHTATSALAGLPELRIVEQSASLLHLHRLDQLVSAVSNPQLKFPPWRPVVHPLFAFLPNSLNEMNPEIADRFFERLTERDVMAHHPFHSWTHSVLAMLRAACLDPKVTDITISLYRVAENSAVVQSLVEAATTFQKRVTCIVELRASLDEERNAWAARRLRDTGRCRVLFGRQAWIMHAKLLVVTRREGGDRPGTAAPTERLYAQIGSGNYNESTCDRYTDLSYFTSNPLITAEITQLLARVAAEGVPIWQEVVLWLSALLAALVLYVAAIFSLSFFKQLLASKSETPTEPVPTSALPASEEAEFPTQHVLVSPFNMRDRFLALIAHETEMAKSKAKSDSSDDGLPDIFACCNALDDGAIVEALIQAAQAGANIFLSVRGPSRITPKMRNIRSLRIISVVGRFLEHTRFFYFRNGWSGWKDANGEPSSNPNSNDSQLALPRSGPMYIVGSADWAHSKLSKRIEIALPVRDPLIASHLERTMRLYLSTSTACQMQEDGSYSVQSATTARADDVQVSLMKLVQQSRL
ncbi:polyphosphate kinase [Capsaspora owczarzaki ATCC 30864]|uniref:Polyphosphate kinase n=1 Tax=Capsaspora owczarzaki (strain ATCC 30864) TaxID=595528 RepID=A0A0D2UNF5_CAPO3|nr:polyphosphate kinase [Capsaspora owczarzaki ATCC 30864]KJE96531.1 polyphosphate kinase [Capsaspora owczarzaki ATCC 30864]|eukprot:XP_004344461.2 polyphosphate kinase [Capsaspora owczarzaki ATCC 30864]